MSTSKIWFITGASRGLGRIWAEGALARGDRVVATARDVRALDPLGQAHGDAVLALPLDVADRDAVFDAVRQADRHFGRLDVVLCNAGYGYMGAIEELEPAQVRANFDTNVFGTLSVMQATLPLLRAQGSGHILTVSSIGGLIGFPTGGSYTASKFVVEALSEALAGEVAAFGIKVTIIEPDHFATGFGASVRMPPPLAAYDPVRKAVRASFKPEDVGDPAATTAAIFAAVDAEEAPLRLVLGAKMIDKLRAVHASRMDNWARWEGVSNAAQGRPHG